MIVTIDGIPVYQASVNADDPETGMFKISLVDDPAVQSNFQVFANKRPQMYAVADEDKRLVFGVVMRADFPIYRRDDSMGVYDKNRFSKELSETLYYILPNLKAKKQST